MPLPVLMRHRARSIPEIAVKLHHHVRPVQKTVLIKRLPKALETTVVILAD